MSSGRTPPGGRFVKYNAAALVMALALAGCATAPAPQMQTIEVTGPRFARTDFDCGNEPLPPDPKAATGRTAARYENALGGWGRGCKDRLQSVSKQLDAAHQVVGE